MQIKTKIVLKNLKGEPLKNEDKEPLTLGEVISSIMTWHKTGGKMKCYILAEKFAKDGIVDIDKADISLIKDAAEATEIYNNMVTGQALILLDDLSEKEEKKKK